MLLQFKAAFDLYRIYRFTGVCSIKYRIHIIDVFIAIQMVIINKDNTKNQAYTKDPSLTVVCTQERPILSKVSISRD